MAKPPIGELLAAARIALEMNQTELGSALGASRRSGQRWVAGQSTPVPAQVEKLATLVYPVDKILAGRLAKWAGTTIEALSVNVPPVAPPPAFPPPAPEAPPSEPSAPELPPDEPSTPELQAAAPSRSPSPAAELLADSVVCAAAEATDISPRTVRPVLLAALTRARQLGMTLEMLDAVLRATQPAPRPPTS